MNYEREEERSLELFRRCEFTGKVDWTISATLKKMSQYVCRKAFRYLEERAIKNQRVSVEEVLDFYNQTHGVEPKAFGDETWNNGFLRFNDQFHVYNWLREKYGVHSNSVCMRDTKHSKSKSWHETSIVDSYRLGEHEMALRKAAYLDGARIMSVKLQCRTVGNGASDAKLLQKSRNGDHLQTNKKESGKRKRRDEMATVVETMETDENRCKSSIRMRVFYTQASEAYLEAMGRRSNRSKSGIFDGDGVYKVLWIEVPRNQIFNIHGVEIKNKLRHTCQKFSSDEANRRNLQREKWQIETSLVLEAMIHHQYTNGDIMRLFNSNSEDDSNIECLIDHSKIENAKESLFKRGFDVFASKKMSSDEESTDKWVQHSPCNGNGNRL